MNNFLDITRFSNESLILLGILIGYILGFFLSNKQEIHFEISKKDLEDLHKEVVDDSYESAYADYVKKSVNNSIEPKDVINLLKKSNRSLYKVTVPFFIAANSFEEAFTRVLKSIKHNKKGFVNGGAVDTPNAYAEELNEYKIIHIFEESSKDYEDAFEGDIDWEDFLNSPQYEKYHRLVTTFQNSVEKIKEEYLNSKDETN